MSNLIVFLVIGAFYVVSALVQAAAKQAKEKESSRRGQRQGSNNFMEEMQRRAAEQQRRQESRREAPVVLRKVQRRDGQGQALKARVVARPARQAPAQANVTPARARHLHSRLEGERDLSDVDERHLSHLTGNLRSQEASPETERESAPRGGRALGNQKVTDYSVDESIRIEDIGAHLTPMQRALVLSEILTRRPAFENDDTNSLF